MVKNLTKKGQRIMKSRRGFIEIVAIILVLVFIVIKVATPVKNVGETSEEAVKKLNTQLRVELGLDD